MATKVKKEAKAAKKAEAKETKKVAKKAKKELTPEQIEKRKARAEAIKNRPAGQRTNSKQIDVIETEKGKVMNYACPIKGAGVIVTSVALNAEGEVIGTSVNFIPVNLTVKTKKGHGYLKFPKGYKGEKDADLDEEEEVDVEDSAKDADDEDED